MFEEAVGLFRCGAETLPGSTALRNKLGEALEGAGRPAEALRCYQEAQRLAAWNHDPARENYRRNSERAAAVVKQTGKGSKP